MDDDLTGMCRERLIEEIRKLRRGIRTHRDSTKHDLCWHHPELWGLLPEKQDPLPIVPEWPQFIQGMRGVSPVPGRAGGSRPPNLGAVRGLIHAVPLEAVMRLKHVYLVLCILGTVIPYSQFIPFVQENGLRLGLLVQQLFVNHVSGFFGLDVILSSVVVLVFIRVEGRRIGVSRLWLPRVAILTVGVSLALPLFLYMREVRQEVSPSR